MTGISVTGESYESLYRRSERALPCLLAIVVAAGIVLIIAFNTIADGNTQLTVVLSVTGLVVFALFAVLVTTFRMHRWTIEAGGVRIEERPKVPFTGFRYRASVTFENIAALRRVQSGFDTLAEIATRDGRRYRLAPIFYGTSTTIGVPDVQSLEMFIASIRTAAAREGKDLPAVSEGLSFWNGPIGLVLLVVMLAISLVIASAVAWALWDGLTMQPRGGYSAAIALLLPFGAGYLLWRSLQRRWAVLARKNFTSV